MVIEQSLPEGQSAQSTMPVIPRPLVVTALVTFVKLRMIVLGPLPPRALSIALTQVFVLPKNRKGIVVVILLLLLPPLLLLPRPLPLVT